MQYLLNVIQWGGAMKDNLVQTRVNEQVHKQLENIAKQTGRTISDLVREAVMSLIGVYRDKGGRNQ